MGVKLTMRSKTKISPEDVALFRHAVKRVVPLQQDQITPVPRRPSPHPQQKYLDEQQVLRDMLSDGPDTSAIETGEELLFHRKGLQHGLLRKLRRGQFSVGAELDLHGLTVVEARDALGPFLAACRLSNARCVRIIHGKGYGSRRKQPVLKGKVNQWLQQRDEVLAFCSARPVDGGTGAVYVLLKKG